MNDALQFPLVFVLLWVTGRDILAPVDSDPKIAQLRRKVLLAKIRWMFTDPASYFRRLAARGRWDQALVGLRKTVLAQRKTGQSMLSIRQSLALSGMPVDFPLEELVAADTLEKRAQFIRRSEVSTAASRN